MRYLSTRGGAPVSAAEAIVRGICPSGGLYVPEAFPKIGLGAALALSQDYQGMARLIMGQYLDIPEEELTALIKSAYGPRFDTPAIAPVMPLRVGESVLELWHGPTLAFKDMALQMLPYLMRDSIARTGTDKKVYILVATSGDTGKAALEGFCGVPGTAIQVFYPDGGVSRAQRMQMVTQEGNNVHVCAVRGNFDDAQTGVKKIFADPDIKEQLAQRGWQLSSANSINFGRLLPQIVYYWSAYAQLVAAGRIQQGDKVNFCVPTGNFGDILAGYYAMRMGLPVHKLLCASNRNNVLTDFFHTGAYDSRRPFYKSMSCSIDILISSNLERLVFEMAGRDAGKVSAFMQSLKEGGSYQVDAGMLEKMGALFVADWCGEADTLATIRTQFEQTGYLMDPHTAVGQTMLNRYVQATADHNHTVLLSTANPFKFATDVLGAFEAPKEDDFENARRLSALTGAAVPVAISGLHGKLVLHSAVCELSEMGRRVLEVLD